MRPTVPPWPSRVSDAVLWAVVIAGSLVFLVLAAGNPVQPDRLVALQLAFTAGNWNAVLADGVANDAVRSHLVRDVLGMMPAYTLALTALFTVLWRRASAGLSRASAGSLLAAAWLAVGVFVFDVVENAAMWAAASDGGPGDGLVLVVSLAATLKWALLLAAVLTPAVSALRGGGRA